MFRVIRAGAALVIVAVLVVQLQRVLERDLGLYNFLSYFTVLSNLASAFVLAALVVRPHLISSTRFAIVRGMVTLWMVSTAVFFAAWISPNLDDTLRHVVSPIVLLADWLLNPGPRISPSRSTLIWMVPPGLYVVYTMVRGIFVGWYPYIFLDPTGRGYLAVVGLIFIMMTIMAASGVLLASWPGYSGNVLQSRESSYSLGNWAMQVETSEGRVHASTPAHPSMNRK